MFVHLRDPRAHARTVLPLQRELNLEGSGGPSTDFFSGFSSDAKQRVSEDVVHRFQEAFGSPLFSSMAPEWHLKTENWCSRRRMLSKAGLKGVQRCPERV